MGTGPGNIVKQTAFVFPPDEHVPAPLQVTLVGCDWSDPDLPYSYTRESAAHTAFEYVTAGTIALDINGLNLRPQAGDAYIIHKGSRFHAHQADDKPWAKLWLIVVGALAENMIPAYGLDQVYHIRDFPSRGLFEDAFRIASSGGDRQDIQQRLAVIAYSIILALSSAAAQSACRFSPEILRAKNYLDSRVDGTVTTADLGRAMGRSPAHALRLFKKEMGISPHAYFLNRKIEEAKVLLLHSHLTVKEIAYRLGFADEFHFSNAFKRKTGASPTSFRSRASAARPVASGATPAGSPIPHPLNTGSSRASPSPRSRWRRTPWPDS
jgi:AraC-like DNA-binding protein